MLRVVNSNGEINRQGPGAVVRMRIEGTAGYEYVYCLVAPYLALPYSKRSDLRAARVYAANGIEFSSGGIPSEWAIRVWGDERRRTTLVQLTQAAVNELLARGVTSVAVGTVAQGMRVSYVTGAGELIEVPARIDQVAGETLKLDIEAPLNGLLVGADGKLLAVTEYDDSKHYPLVDIVNEFLEERLWQMRCDSEQLVREMERLSKEHTELQSHYFSIKGELVPHEPSKPEKFQRFDRVEINIQSGGAPFAMQMQLTGAQWRMHTDAKEPVLVSIVSCASRRNYNFARNLSSFTRDTALADAVAGAFAREPALAGAVAGAFAREPALAGAFAREPALSDAVAGVFAREPALADAFSREPELANAFAREPALARAFAREPALADTVARAFALEPALANSFAREPSIARAFALEPAIADAFARERNITVVYAREPALARAFAQVPLFARAFDRELELEAALFREPSLGLAFAREPALADAFTREPELARAFAREPALPRAFAREPALADAFAREPALARAIAREPGLADALAREDAFARAFAREPALADAFARDPTLTDAFAREPAPLVFGVDVVNRCVKRLYSTTGNLLDAYRAPGDTGVHNVLLPNTYDENELYIIESKQVSHLVGVLYRDETTFSLVRLAWRFEVDREDKEAWECTGSAEFYRVDTKQLVPQAPPTSLCRAGSHVLCAVSSTYRLAAFVYKGRDEPLKAAGDQRFDEKLLHVDALNSATGPLIAIAFADESIRLYRNEAQHKKTRFSLLETFRVFCENVDKLLFAGERLLVAERSGEEDEDEHRVWSCRVMGERLYPEGRVLLGSPISVASWCYDAKFKHIYYVDALTKETLRFELSMDSGSTTQPQVSAESRSKSEPKPPKSRLSPADGTSGRSKEPLDSVTSAQKPLNEKRGTEPILTNKRFEDALLMETRIFEKEIEFRLKEFLNMYYFRHRASRNSGKLSPSQYELSMQIKFFVTINRENDFEIMVELPNKEPETIKEQIYLLNNIDQINARIKESNTEIRKCVLKVKEILIKENPIELSIKTNINTIENILLSSIHSILSILKSQEKIVEFLEKNKRDIINAVHILENLNETDYKLTLVEKLIPNYIFWNLKQLHQSDKQMLSIIRNLITQSTKIESLACSLNEVKALLKKIKEQIVIRSIITLKSTNLVFEYPTALQSKHMPIVNTNITNCCFNECPDLYHQFLKTIVCPELGIKYMEHVDYSVEGWPKKGKSFKYCNSYLQIIPLPVRPLQERDKIINPDPNLTPFVYDPDVDGVIICIQDLRFFGYNDSMEPHLVNINGTIVPVRTWKEDDPLTEHQNMFGNNYLAEREKTISIERGTVEIGSPDDRDSINQNMSQNQTHSTTSENEFHSSQLNFSEPNNTTLTNDTAKEQGPSQHSSNFTARFIEHHVSKMTLNNELRDAFADKYGSYLTVANIKQLDYPIQGVLCNYERGKKQKTRPLFCLPMELGSKCKWVYFIGDTGYDDEIFICEDVMKSFKFESINRLIEGKINGFLVKDIIVVLDEENQHPVVGRNLFGCQFVYLAGARITVDPLAGLAILKKSKANTT